MVSNEIIKERENGEFKDFMDFVKRTYSKSVNRKVLENLINAGCFMEFGINNHTLINSIDLAINYAELAHDLDDSLIEKPEFEMLDEYSEEELMRKELSVYGFYLSTHPLSKFKNDKSININMLNRFIDKNISIMLMIDDIKEIETKKKDKMAFYKCSDEYNSIDLTLFPKTYDIYKDIEANTLINVNGRVDKRNDKLQIIANTITIL